MSLYFGLWAFSIIGNFVYPFDHAGIITYSIFISFHPFVILITLIVAFKMDINTFERANEKKKDDPKNRKD
jgi:hypothetical protein